MKDQHPEEGAGCDCCRRDFLGAMGLAAGGFTLGYATLAAAEQAGKAATRKKEPATVRAAFVYTPSAKLRGRWWSWPGNDFDAEGRQVAYTKGIKEIEKKLGMRILVEKTPLDSAGSLAKFIAEVKQSKPDGVLLIPFYNRSFGHIDRILREVKIPAVVFSCLGVKHGTVKQYKRPGM